MLRRWVSTVFWLRKSSAAIWGFVLRSTTSRASSSSRSVSEAMPPSPLPAACAGRRCRRAFGARAPPARASAGRRTSRTRPRRARAPSPPGRAPRPQRALARRGAEPLRRGSRAPTSSSAAAASSARAAASAGSRVEGDGGRRDAASPPGIGSPTASAHAGQPRPRVRLPRACPPRVTAREELEAAGPPGAGDHRELLASGRRQEQLGGPSGRPSRASRGERLAASPGRGRGRGASPSSTLSCRGREASSTSPAASAANDRLKGSRRGPGRCRRGARPRSRRRAPRPPPPFGPEPTGRRPSIGTISGKRSPCPVARPIAQCAPGVTARPLEPVEVPLRGGEVDERVEAPGKLVVRQPVDQLGGLRALCLRLGRCAAERAARATASAAAVRARSPSCRGPTARRPSASIASKSPRYSPSHGELDHQRDRLGRGMVFEFVESGLQPCVCLRGGRGVLDAGACGGQPDSQRTASRGTIAMLSTSAAWLSAKRPVAASAPACASSSSTRSSVGASPEQPERRFEPARRARRRALRGRLSGLAKDRDGGRVTGPRRILDVVGTNRGRAPGRERLGAALVRAQPPAARASTRRPRAARADGGSGSGGERPLARTRSTAAARRGRPSPRAPPSPPAAAASSGSKGSPATAAPWSTSARRPAAPELLERARPRRLRNLDARRARPRAEADPRAARSAGGRAARGRTDCRRSPRTGCRGGPWPPRPAAPGLVAGSAPARHA